MKDNPTPARRRRKSNLENMVNRTPRREISEILQCAVDWLPYGRPPEEIVFLRFGLNARQFSHRIVCVLTEFPSDLCLEGSLRQPVGGVANSLKSEYAKR